MGRKKLSTLRAKSARQNNQSLVGAAGGSKQDEPKVPQPKRQRTNQDIKTVTQKNQVRERLSGLVKLPINIFAKVASYLTPGDIIGLSRSNKFLRNLLMRRSAVHIWQSAMRNVPKLPPCPPDMCEPEYLALIYTPTCSVCGESGTKRMDEVLCVRLCNACFDDRTMPVDGLPVDIQPLVLKSTIKAIGWYGRHADTRHSALRTDVGAVLVATGELKKSRNDAALAEWKIRRLEELEARKKRAAVLGAFLDYLEEQEIRRQDSLRAQRRAEIARRFLLLGWDEKDLEACCDSNPEEWGQLVIQLEPVTDHIWADIKTRLDPILQANRLVRLAQEEKQRKYARRRKLAQIMEEIQAAEPLLINTRISLPRLASQSTASVVQVSHQRFFPLTADLLEYPIIQSLDETDIPASAMEARFEAHREAIKAHVLKWKIKIEGHLAGLLREGRASDGLKKAAPAPTLPVGKSEPTPFKGVSEDLKLLLRADSLFEPRRALLGTPVTYDSLLAASFSISAWGLFRARPLDLTEYKRHGKAQEIARVLLAGMGRTNASFLELRSIGQRFMCGSCPSRVARTWEEMVEHYADEQRNWERYRAYVPKAQKNGIIFQHLHALDAKPKKPFVKLLSSTQNPNSSNHSKSKNWKCRLCMKIEVHDQGVTEGEVIEHVFKWHGVAKPEEVEHYDKFGHSYSDEEDGGGYHSYGSDDYGYRRQTRCAYYCDDEYY
ncbi:hypothetical protein BDV93DRAFT_481991 [Ceratobasidium sp. AG-I]|nr:hypothetical protein BDV93DRAFT_481991 [Ceratobasidium sp. AG-I]